MTDEQQDELQRDAYHHDVVDNMDRHAGGHPGLGEAQRESLKAPELEARAGGFGARHAGRPTLTPADVSSDDGPCCVASAAGAIIDEVASWPDQATVLRWRFASRGASIPAQDVLSCPERPVLFAERPLKEQLEAERKAEEGPGLEECGYTRSEEDQMVCPECPVMNEWEKIEQSEGREAAIQTAPEALEIMHVSRTERPGLDAERPLAEQLATESEEDRMVGSLEGEGQMTKRRHLLTRQEKNADSGPDREFEISKPAIPEGRRYCPSGPSGISVMRRTVLEAQDGDTIECRDEEMMRCAKKAHAECPGKVLDIVYVPSYGADEPDPFIGIVPEET